jgi:2-C-methyl-D-erythritol 4-phosphate cytidylyltransferase
LLTSFLENFQNVLFITSQVFIKEQILISYSVMKASPINPNGCLWALVPAGGSGQRFSSTEDKLLAQIDGRSVLSHSVNCLLSHPWVEGVVLIASEPQQAVYGTLLDLEIPTLLSSQNLRVVTGGRDRRASVWQGLQQIPQQATHVLIHDAARPFLNAGLIESVVSVAMYNKVAGAIAASPVYDTVKQSSLLDDQPASIVKTLDRSTLWRAQTPQVFHLRTLLQAHQIVPLDTPVTDDAQLIELAQLGDVRLVSSDSLNLKITTAEDLRLAQAYWQLSKS